MPERIVKVIALYPFVMYISSAILKKISMYGIKISSKKQFMDIIQFIGTAEAQNSGEQFTTNMHTNGFEFVADEAEVVGGKNLGPAPGDYLCMALASCEAMTLRMYIQRKKWNVDTINVKVKLKKGGQLHSGMNTFYSEIAVTGSINEEQQQRMLHIAKACPISRLFQKQNEVVTTISQF